MKFIFPFPVKLIRLPPSNHCHINATFQGQAERRIYVPFMLAIHDCVLDSALASCCK
jgi:hypothetical protein